jgi:hypothetical protein
MLVFDLGSSSVGGALFWVQSSGVPKIIAAFREVITIEKDVDPSRFFASTMKSLDSIALKFLKLGLGAPKDIFCVLSSPWYVSQTRVIRFEKNTPFVFTSKVADDLIKKEMNLFEEEHMKQYLDAESPVRLIEVKNIKIMLNGYETPSPLNQKVKELVMTIFISMSPEQVLKKIEDTIGGHFSSEKIKFSSFMLSSFAVLRDMYIKNENFLLLEIGGEMTDIAMAKKNTLRESVSFPLGRNFIIRGVAEALKCSLPEALSTISLFQDGHAVDSVAKKLEPIITILKKEWLQKFQESLANFSKDISIPAIIYMIVEKDLADFFTQTIATEQFNQYTLTESKFQIIFLDAQVFLGKVEYAEDIIRDPGLVIDSIYINRFLSAKGGSVFGGK